MTTVPSTVEQPPVAEEQPARSADHPSWLVIGCYLVGAVVLTARPRAETPRPGRFLVSLAGRPAFRMGTLLAWQR